MKPGTIAALVVSAVAFFSVVVISNAWVETTRLTNDRLLYETLVHRKCTLNIVDGNRKINCP